MVTYHNPELSMLRTASDGPGFLGAFAVTMPAWMNRAACAQFDLDGFFPEHGQSTASAKAVCQQCPVREECLAYAVENNERHGVWGGVSARERLRARAPRGGAVA